ncbi:MAG: flagellar biosynthesis protein FliQ [Anaerolineaceae bacterium]
MTESYLITFAQNALLVTMFIAAPILLTSLIVGSFISLIQAATQINEVTLTFVPKMIGIILVFALLGGWMGQQLVTFTNDIFISMPSLVK